MFPIFHTSAPPHPLAMKKEAGASSSRGRRSTNTQQEAVTQLLKKARQDGNFSDELKALATASGKDIGIGDDEAEQFNIFDANEDEEDEEKEDPEAMEVSKKQLQAITDRIEQGLAMSQVAVKLAIQSEQENYRAIIKVVPTKKLSNDEFNASVAHIKSIIETEDKLLQKLPHKQTATINGKETTIDTFRYVPMLTNLRFAGRTILLVLHDQGTKQEVERTLGDLIKPKNMRVLYGAGAGTETFKKPCEATFKAVVAQNVPKTSIATTWPQPSSITLPAWSLQSKDGSHCYASAVTYLDDAGIMIHKILVSTRKN